MPDPSTASTSSPAAPAPTTCQAKSSDGHPCSLPYGHESFEREGVTMSAADRAAGCKRHRAADGRLFATDPRRS